MYSALRSQIPPPCHISFAAERHRGRVIARLSDSVSHLLKRRRSHPVARARKSRTRSYRASGVDNAPREGGGGSGGRRADRASVLSAKKVRRLPCPEGWSERRCPTSNMVILSASLFFFLDRKTFIFILFVLIYLFLPAWRWAGSGCGVTGGWRVEAKRRGEGRGGPLCVACRLRSGSGPGAPNFP